MKNTES